MKKFSLFAFIITACLLVGCEPNIPENIDDEKPKDENPQVETDSSLDDEKNNCTVSLVSETTIVKATSISIKDKNGKSVGQGAFFGDYYVPYDGKIIVQYEYYCNYWYWTTERGGCEKWYPDSFELAVSSDKRLEVKIFAQNVDDDFHTDLVIYVNGAIWKVIEH